MKPLKLTMQAFSTYLERTVIDFTALNNAGLYLIAGDTGAGKTTIFDAISYALYSQTSGTNRSNDVFRSQFASFDIPTIVELTFSLNNKTYDVERKATYSKTGKTKTDHDLLKEPNGKMTSGKAAVNKRLKELLGVDATQFKRIVMIAQGEFTRLLNASSTDKVTIFRSIFNTDNLDQLAKNITAKSNELNKKWENRQLELDTMLRSLDLDRETFDESTLPYLKELLDAHKQELTTLEKQKQARTQKVQEASALYEQHKAQNQRIDDYHRYVEEKKMLDGQGKEYDQLHKEIMLLEQIRDLQSKENEVKRLATESESLLKTAMHLDNQQAALKEKRTSYSSQAAEIPAMEKKISDFHVLLDGAVKKEKAKKDYKKIEKEFGKAQEECEEHQGQLARLLKNIDKKQKDQRDCEKRMAELPSYQMKAENLKDQYKKILDRIRMMHELSDAFDVYNKKNDDYLEAADSMNKEKEQLEKDEAFVEEGRRLFMNDQIGFLASGLKEGEACPVCGSTHHPHLATRAKSNWSAQAIESLEKNLKEKKDRFTRTQEDVQDKKHVCDQEYQKVENLRVQLDLEAELSRDHFVRALGEATAKRKEIEKENETLEGEISFRKALIRKQEDENKKLEKMEKKSETLKAQIAERQQETAQLKGQMNTILKEYPDLFEKTASTAELTDQMNDLKEQRQHLLDLKNQLTKESATLNALAEENRKNQKETENDLKSARESFDESLAHLTLNQEQYNLKKGSLKHLKEYKDKYTSYQSERNLINGSLNALKDVAGLVKADLGKEKQELEELRSNAEEKDNDYSAKRARYETIKKTYKSMANKARGNVELMKQNQQYHHLAKIINGTNASKMTFETYVLAAYFTQVLDYANIELKRLTQNRYEFICRTEVIGNGKQGLGLNVIDYETGQQRDVKTLSGGESFKASLALALGLSSMIQSMSGGIELNTLFIDEGFGTLDQESLDTAVNVLVDMKDDNKVIGIISHVSELENRIDAKIRVTKGTHGSFLKVDA